MTSKQPVRVTVLESRLWAEALPVLEQLLFSSSTLQTLPKSGPLSAPGRVAACSPANSLRAAGSPLSEASPDFLRSFRALRAACFFEFFRTALRVADGFSPALGMRRVRSCLRDIVFRRARRPSASLPRKCFLARFSRALSDLLARSLSSFSQDAVACLLQAARCKSRDRVSTPLSRQGSCRSSGSSATDSRGSGSSESAGFQ